MKHLFGWLAPYRKEWAMGSVAALLYSGADLVFPWGSKLIFDQVIHQKKVNLFPWIIALILASILLRFFFAYIKNRTAFRISEKSAVSMRQACQAALFQRPPLSIESQSSANLLNLFVNDVDCLKRFYYEALTQLFFSALYIAVVVGFMFWLNPFLALAAVMVLPGTAFLFFCVHKGQVQDLHQIRENQGRWMNRFQEVIQLIKTVVLSNQQNQEQKRLKALWRQGYRLAMKMNARNALFLSMGEAVASLCLIFFLSLGAWFVLKGTLSLGALLAFYIAFSYLFLPIGRMVGLKEKFKEAGVSFTRIESFLAFGAREKTIKKMKKLKNWDGSFSFNRVSFGYEPNNLILRDLSFYVKKGETVALVGKSGAGKSTLIHLLCGFIQPTDGEIALKGLPLAQTDLKTYYSQLGAVFQTEPVWSASFLDNILYGSGNKSSQKIQEILKRSFLDERVHQLKEKEQTLIGANGVSLSLGEQKRVALSRAFAKNPKLYLFDEAAAALDSHSEDHIQKSMKELVDATIVVVAHRLSTVWHANRVLVLDRGTIVETGKPSDLLRPGTCFYDLFQYQIKDAFPLKSKMNVF